MPCTTPLSSVICTNILTFRFKCPQSKHLLTPSSHAIIYPLLSTSVSSAVLPTHAKTHTSGREKRGEWGLNAISNHQEMSCRYCCNDKCRKNWKQNKNNRKTCFVYFTTEQKIIEEKKKKPFSAFFSLTAYYVAKTYSSNSFLVCAKAFFKDIFCGWLLVRILLSYQCRRSCQCRISPLEFSFPFFILIQLFSAQ